MSKILVIEPYRMLQQAIALFLVPAHVVQMCETVPESLPANDFDALIVDGAGLREITGLDAKIIDRIQNWRVPILWIDKGESDAAPKGEKVVVASSPLDREALASALARCLGNAVAARENGTPKPRDKEAASSGNAAAAEKVIELVEVVEDASPHAISRGGQNRTK